MYVLQVYAWLLPAHIHTYVGIVHALDMQRKSKRKCFHSLCIFAYLSYVFERELQLHIVALQSGPQLVPHWGLEVQLLTLELQSDDPSPTRLN